VVLWSALDLWGFFPPFFLRCKLTNYQPAVKIASGIHQMQVFILKSSWSPACTEPISRRQAYQSRVTEAVFMNRALRKRSLKVPDQRRQLSQHPEEKQQHFRPAPLLCENMLLKTG